MSEEELFVAIAGMIFVLLISAMVIGGVLLFPITRRFSALLRAKERAESRGVGLESGDSRQLLAALQGLQARLDTMEERQSFTERLLEEKRSPSLPGDRP